MTTKKLPLSDLDWDDVRLFLQISRTGSLSQAARLAKVDQSTISRRLSQLELCLGGALFERRRVGLKPTELAHVLIPQAEAMERAVLSLLEKLGGDERLPSGSVRVAMMEGIGTMFIARHLRGLQQNYPNIHVELVTSSSVVNVSRREADVFLSFFKPEGQGLECEHVGSIALYLYASAEYLEACGHPVDIEDLQRHRFVGYIDDLIQLDAVRWLNELVPQPTMSFQSNSMLAQMTAAASGLGMVLLPKFSVIKEDSLIPVLPLKARVTRDLWLSVHNDLQYSDRIRVVVAYLRNLLRNKQDWLSGPPDDR
jgi:DNA-binding transcriptional LysR family regulator